MKVITREIIVRYASTWLKHMLYYVKAKEIDIIQERGMANW